MLLFFLRFLRKKHQCDRIWNQLRAYGLQRQNIVNSGQSKSRSQSAMARKRKKRSPVMSILAFVTTIVIVITFIYLRGKKHTVQEVSTYTNTSFNGYQNVYVRDSRRTLLSHSIYKKRLVDSLWTKKPKISSKWENQNKLNYIYDDIRGRTFLKEIENEDLDEEFPQTTPLYVESTSSSSNLFASQTTPSVTDAPTPPITTQSETTPLYTDSPTSPITTESVTTPIVTEPGEIEATTELDLDNIDSETLMLIRNRRGIINGGTTTTPFPLTTSVEPPGCGDDDDAPWYYLGPYGDCECGLGYKGPFCTDDVKPEIFNSLFFKSLPFGKFPNSTRKDFQEQLDDYYSQQPGFVRAFVMPLVYDPETNKTELGYYLIFDRPANARAAARSASITANITGHILPIMIDNQLVRFSENSTFFVRPRPDNTIDLIPIGSQTLENVCYIYDEIGACEHGNNEGTCKNINGQPYCICTKGYIGEFCEEKVKYPPEDINDRILEVLLPILAAVAACAAMCSCCFFFLRRANKGDDVASIYSEDSSWAEYQPVILPRYFPHAWKQFIAGAEETEEQHYAYSNVDVEEVTPVIIERPVIQPVIVERVVVEERPVREERRFIPVTVEERRLIPAAIEEHCFIPVDQDQVDEASVISQMSTAFSGQSVILPRFHKTPFKQLIPGSESNSDEQSILTFTRTK